MRDNYFHIKSTNKYASFINPFSLYPPKSNRLPFLTSVKTKGIRGNGKTLLYYFKAEVQILLYEQKLVRSLKYLF